ncbi:MAG: hypothetical protein LW817_00895 [Candidatus Caenarcaniphilales bacterium]|jgi:hypothetical protein|nr:hypothetical protein [Candidatus Caenarcaniphilales bacterium]
MGNSIADQAMAAANNGAARSNRYNVNELEQQQQEAMFASSAAKSKQQNFQAIAQYNSSGAEQEKLQGNNMLKQGAAKKMLGGVQIAMGAGMMAMAAIPIAGAAMLTAGIEMMAQGMGSMIMGTVDTNNGKASIMRAQEKLELATSNQVMAKEESVVVNREMMRSKLFEMKKEMMEAMQETIKPMLEKAGIDGKDLNEDQIGKWFDKMFEQGANTLANGGILETDLTGLDGNPLFKDTDGNAIKGDFHFMRDEAGEFYQIEPARDKDGNAALGASGEPLLDTEAGVKKVEDGQLKEYLKLQFMFVDQLKQMAGSLGTYEADANGGIHFTPYETANIEHMKDFADLVSKTNFTDIKAGRSPGPLKMTVEADGVYLQEWDWNKNIPLGPKTPVDDMAGGEYDRGDIESYQLAMERSQTALQQVGLNAGGKRFNLLASNNGGGLKRATNTGSTFDQLSSKDGDAFKNFTSITTVTSQLNSNKSLLSASTADDTGNGRA